MNDKPAPTQSYAPSAEEFWKVFTTKSINQHEVIIQFAEAYAALRTAKLRDENAKLKSQAEGQCDGCGKELEARERTIQECIKIADAHGYHETTGYKFAEELRALLAGGVRCGW